MYHCAWPTWLPDVTWPKLTWPLRGSLRRMECAHAQPEVAQYPPYWGLFTVSDHFGVPFEGCGARMRNRKLRNIRSNVTRRTSPGKYGSARICSLCYVVLQGYFLSRPRSHCGISTKWMKLVNVTRSDAIKPKVGVSALFLVFSDIFEVFRYVV